jgi:glycosyltransferase involved in cell wall biosynthesis
VNKPGIVFCRSNPVAPDPRVEKEALALAQAGYPVQVVAWDRSAALPAHQLLSIAGQQIEITRLPIRAEYARGVRNLPDLLRWQIGLLRWLLHKRSQFTILHACDFDTILPALVLKALFGKQVVYDIFDFYADHLRATPQALKTLIRVVDRWAIRAADALILVDDSRWEQIGDLRPARSAVIYNSPADLRLAQSPLEQAEAPPSASLTIAYIGLLQAERGLFELLQVLKQRPEWLLHLAGFGGDEQRLLAAIAGMPNVQWHGRVPYARALELSRQADVLLATYDPAIPNHRYASPNKVFEAMMLGKPVIVAQDTNVDRVIASGECGLVVPYGDPAALQAALERLQFDPGLRQRLGNNARRVYEQRYSWEIMRQRLLALYASLQDKQQGRSP